MLNSVRNLTIFIKHSTSVERRKMKVMGLSEENTENITFNLANTKVMKTMVAYYRETYNYAIRLKKLPCLLIKSKVKQYIPMELCFIQAGEKMPGKLTSLEMEGLVLLTRDKPSNRRLAIEEMMRKQHGPYDPTNLRLPIPPLSFFQHLLKSRPIFLHILTTRKPPKCALFSSVFSNAMHTIYKYIIYIVNSGKLNLKLSNLIF